MRNPASRGLQLGLVTSCAAVFGLFATGAREAKATGFEVPENGTEIMGRAGAWTARADNPMAAALNPAGLAGQGTGFLVNANLTWQKFCFARAGSYSTNANNAGTVFQGNAYGGQAYPEVCKKNGFGDVNVVPQIAFNYAVTDKLGVALAVVTPSAAGKAKWPETVTVGNGEIAPSPQRYMLLEQNGVVISPTLAAGYEVAKGVRFGAAFQATMAFLEFSNVSQALNTTQSDVAEGPNADLKAKLTIKKLFTPGFILGALITPMDDFDIGAMFHWSADVTAKDGDVTILGPSYGSGTTKPNTPAETKAKVGEFRLPAPIDVRVGFRYHPMRPGGKVVPSGKRRDMLASDAWDIELDLTYTHNKSVDQLTLLFPANQCVALGVSNCAGYVPVDASVPHKWKDQVGARLGGEWVAMPDLLGIRAGAFYQTSSIDKQYVGIDFLPSSMFGLYLGATLRLSKLVDLSAGFGHIFVTPVDNNGDGAVHGLNAQAQWDPALCPLTSTNPGATANRTCNPINGGKATMGYNMGSIGATFHL
jgi:long-subunit fatty acid transport protein